MFLRSVLSLTLALGALAPLHAAAPSDLPAPVQKALAAQIQGGEVQSVEKSDDHGHVTYDVEIAKAGDVRSYSVSAEGVLESAELTLAETPAAVQKAIAARVGSATLDQILRINDGGDVSYDVDWTNAAGEAQSFSLSDTGALTSISLALKDVPEGIRHAINLEVADGKLEGIDKITEDGETTYDISWNDKAGQPQSFSLSEKGAIISKQVALASVPPPVQKAIQAKIGAGSLVRIDHSLEGKKKEGHTFEVVATINGQNISFRVGPKGKLLADD